MHLALTLSVMLCALLTRAAKGLCLPVILIALSLSGTSFAQSDPGSFVDKLRPRVWIGDAEERYSLNERMAAYGVQGVAVAIIDDGEVVFASGFGVRQSGATDPVDADTVFSAGSVSKVATASLVLRLANAGALNLGAPVAT